ncbi:motility associated factor glycosyltransferase family protein [Sulfurospirillum sp. T05]|uniref:Motility associated factor glycosyltransferase family protein n=1 Tax=Sulfurospirillum tamanense TaxID=2813362 RepID=A0ABS2WS10_9BACT|nr:6-hydroxymethylpterin diphosphokinase MptE-like protein [Sulfurospirillum tamanensis]MBN2964458.1 motility associated factor glycosyltransferase family protein [Sulfurospirillum tamanensis]
MEFFETNLSVLDTHNPPLARRLRVVGELKHFEIFMDEGNVASLNAVHTTHFTPLYEGSPAQSVEEDTARYVAFDEHPFLYMYGLGNGMLIKTLLANPKHERIVVVEPEDELAFVVLHMVDFSAELQSGRLALFGQEEVNFPNALALFGHLKEQRYARVYDLHVTTEYYLKCHELALRTTNQVFLEALYHGINAAGNDPTDSLIGLKHHLVNLPKVLKTPPALELFKKLGTTEIAVLVSTGPSLTKQLPLLKRIAPYVRIVAADASFPVLYRAGIKPDVVVSIERVVESAKFFTELPKEAFEGVVFALTSLQHKEVLESIKGGTLQVSLRPLGYMMLTGPDEWGYIGLGMSAANMAYELIYHSKFKTCMLIGQDLAYGEDGTSHAEGHVFGSTNVKEKEADAWVEGWGGVGRVRTNHTWDMFRKFFEKDIAETKARMLTINATEGGASIYGAVEIPFAEAVALHVKQEKVKIPLELRYASQKDAVRIGAEVERKVEEMATYTQALLEETKALFLDVAAASEDEATSATVFEELMVRIEKVKERFEEPLFEKVVWHIAQSMMLSQEISLASLEVQKVETAAQQEEKTRALVEAYKSWLFAFAGIMDAILKTITFAKTRRLIDEVERIDVEVEGKVIDSFTCKELKPTFGRVFDVDMRGILYDMPDMHVGKAAVFKDAKTGKVLPEAFVSVITREDEKYNELSFMKSLEEPIDEEKIKDLYCPNAIGFLATEENLADEEFVGYIKELMERFPDVEFKGFCFGGNIKEFYEIFVDTKKCKALVVGHIESIATTIGFWIHNSKDVKTNAIIKVLPDNYGVLFCYFDGNFEKTIIDLENTYHQSNQLALKKYRLLFGDTKPWITNFYIETLYNGLFEEFGYKECKIDIHSTFKEFNILRISLCLSNFQFYKQLVKLRKLLK